MNRTLFKVKNRFDEDLEIEIQKVTPTISKLFFDRELTYMLDLSTAKRKEKGLSFLSKALLEKEVEQVIKSHEELKYES